LTGLSDGEADSHPQDHQTPVPRSEAPAANAPSEVDPAKRHLFIIIALIVVVLVIAGAVIWWLIARNYESTDDAYIDAHIVHLSPQIAGRVLNVQIDDNMRVSKGQLLAEIDSADAVARLDQISGQEAQAKAQLAQAEALIEVSQATYQQAMAGVAGAAAQATNAARDLARYRGLRETMPAAVAAQQIDQAEAAAVNTAAQRDAAEKQAKTQVAGALAQLRTVHAQIDQANLNLGYTRVLAPVAGTIARQSVAVGNYLQPGQDMAVIVPFDIWITANFKETQLALMRPGQKVDIAIDACPEISFEGHVDSVERGAGEAFSLLPPENATGNFVKVVQRVPVKILIDEPADGNCPLGPGMSVYPTVHLRDAKKPVPQASAGKG
jgi:membrane fusion protein (multidrug efflux system)